MSQFGSGTAAAVALRRRILDLLGAEPQWLTGDDNARVIAWKSGLAVTFFHVTAGTPDRRDVGMLQVSTPLARRIVLPPGALEWEDKNALVGLAAPQVLHGLAWGETQAA